MALSLSGMLFVTWRWIEARVDEEIALKLNHSRKILQRIHKFSTMERLNRFQSIAVEPRFRALAEISDTETLNYASEEIRNQFNCSLFAFLSKEGEILAWNGIGRNEVGKEINKLLQSQKESLTEILTVNQQVLELALIPIRIQDQVRAYVLGAVTLNNSVLRDYSESIDAKVELVLENDGVHTNFDDRINISNLGSTKIRLGESVSFLIHLDPTKVSKPFYDTLQKLAMISVNSILIGGILILFLASRFSKPVKNLTEVTKKVTKGEFALKVEEIGAPEICDLSRNFNWMLESLNKSRRKLKEHADNLDDLVTKRTEQLNKEISEHKTNDGRVTSDLQFD